MRNNRQSPFESFKRSADVTLAESERGTLDKPERAFRILAEFFPFLWPAGEPMIRVRVVVALLLLILAKLTAVMTPIAYKGAVDQLGLADNSEIAVIPLAFILAYGGAKVLSLMFAEMRDAVFARVGQRAIRHVSLSVFSYLHQLDLQFHLNRQTGGISRIMERGTRAIGTILTYVLFSVFPIIFEMLLVAGVLWYLFNWFFSAIVVSTVVLYIAFTFFVTEWRLRFRRAMNEMDVQASSKAMDSLLNYETVKYFCNENHELERYNQALRQYEQASIYSQSSLSVLNIGQSFIISIGSVAAMTLASFGILNNTMTIGDFVIVNTYILQLYQPLNFFGVVYREIKQAILDMDSLFKLKMVPCSIVNSPESRDLVITGGSISFNDVCFSYDIRRPILSGVSFTVPAGGCVAIVGASGAGKSTIGRLLFRFYDVSAGCIRIDGQDLRMVTQESLRHAVGIVPQDTVLFHDTLAYNIGYGKPGAGAAAVMEAARVAGLTSLIERLPDGLETRVGERGLKLSGGEKQRVAIARTVLKDPPILILDEATSALDTMTEREIQRNLDMISRDRTTLLIAHRLSTVINADEILVLDGGMVVERGPHARLMAEGGVYARLWHRQKEGEACRV